MGYIFYGELSLSQNFKLKTPLTGKQIHVGLEGNNKILHIIPLSTNPVGKIRPLDSKAVNIRFSLKNKHLGLVRDSQIKVSVCALISQSSASNSPWVGLAHYASPLPPT